MLLYVGVLKLVPTADQINLIIPIPKIARLSLTKLDEKVYVRLFLDL